MYLKSHNNTLFFFIIDPFIISFPVIPHQDSTYLYTDPIPPVGFWIALQDVTIQNGCLWISPGSHKSGIHRRLIRNPDKDSKQALIYDRPAPVYPQSSFTAVPVPKGIYLQQVLNILIFYL